MSARLGRPRKRSRKCSLFVLDHGDAWLCVCTGWRICGRTRICEGRRLHARRPEAEIRPRLLARLDPSAHENVERLRLFERIDRVVADPHKLEPGLVHALTDHIVERALHASL